MHIPGTRQRDTSNQPAPNHGHPGPGRLLPGVRPPGGFGSLSPKKRLAKTPCARVDPPSSAALPRLLDGSWLATSGAPGIWLFYMGEKEPRLGVFIGILFLVLKRLQYSQDSNTTLRILRTCARPGYVGNLIWCTWLFRGRRISMTVRWWFHTLARRDTRVDMASVALQSDI